MSDESITRADESTPDSYDPYLEMELSLSRGDDATPVTARVMRRSLDDSDQPIGTAHLKPLMDSRRYEVQFVDGYSETLAANIIAENLISQVDNKGHRQRMITEIVDHQHDERAIPKENGTFTI